jgi:transcriptional regulator
VGANLDFLLVERQGEAGGTMTPAGESSSKPTTDLLQGTLDLLILKTLALEPMHGWGVAQRIQQISKDLLQIGQGSLYPALHRLEYRGWIQSEWGESENNRRAKFYSLTRAGREQLEVELDTWERLKSAIGLVVNQSQEAAS